QGWSGLIGGGADWSPPPPLAESQTSEPLHSLPSSHEIGTPAWQLPRWQNSTPLQGSPSLQLASSVHGCEHVPALWMHGTLSATKRNVMMVSWVNGTKGTSRNVSAPTTPPAAPPRDPCCSASGRS